MEFSLDLAIVSEQGHKPKTGYSSTSRYSTLRRGGTAELEDHGLGRGSYFKRGRRYDQINRGRRQGPVCGEGGGEEQSEGGVAAPIQVCNLDLLIRNLDMPCIVCKI